MGMGGSKTVADRQTSIQIQTSSYGQPVPVVFGTTRIAANMVWFANFTPISHTTKTGGKGGGSSSNTTYTYTASAILALCEGTISGIGSVWKDKDKTTLAALGLTLFTGAQDQPVWSFLSGYSNSTNFGFDTTFGYRGSGASFVSQAINYSGTAYLCASAYNLADGAAVPNHSFEVQGLNIVGSGNQDANPADVVPAILTSQQFGVGFSASLIGSMTTYQTYCKAAGLFISPSYTTQRPAADCIQELCDATNTAPLWSGGTLKFIPYGDTALIGNGATYTPNLTPVYDLADDDFLPKDPGPILVTRVTPADAYNRVQVEFRNRLNQYNQEVVSAEDQDAIEKYGLKIAPKITMDFVCDSGIAKVIAQLALQRLLYKRNTYEFELGARFAMLEPMDIVTLTDPGLQMTRVPVRITSIEEQDDGYSVIAEDLLIGIASAASYAHDNGLRWQNSTAVVPSSVAAPILFELPADPSATGLSVAVAVGGQPGDLMYGGCRVWLSYDGVNYREEGVIYGSSRYGTLSASLAAAAAGMDTANTLALSLRSDGQLISGSSQDVANGSTLILCGSEYLSYQNATLTGTRAYNLTTLKRGLYNTATGSKTSGTRWVRVDNAVAVLKDMDLTMIGKTVYIKLTAFNVYGSAEQDLSAVTAYTYTITGEMKALETPIASTAVVYTDGTPIESLKPAQAGADVTATHTAAAIAGQAPAATDATIETGATRGATAGTNLKDSAGQVLTDASIKNTAVTIGANGQLAGAGGGQVTIGGLGYSGDLNATWGARIGNSLRRADGITIATETDIITPLGIAGGFVGSGSMAYKNAADWDADVSNRPAMLTDTTTVDGQKRLQSHYVFDIVNGGGYLHTRWPAEAGANKTETHTAAGLAGSGTGAYANNLAQLDSAAAATLTAASKPGQNALFNGSLLLGWLGWSNGGLNLIQDYRGNFAEAPYGTGGTFVAESTRAINVGNGAAVTLSAVFTGSATVNAFTFIDIHWFNGGNYAGIGYSSSTSNNCIIYNETVTKKQAFQAMTAPNATDGSGFVKGQVRIVCISDVAYVQNTRWVEQIKVEVGSTPTPFSDEATNPALLGSVPPSIPDNSFTYTSTVNSITISWPAMTVYRADGSTVAIASGSLVTNSLSSSTPYKFYPYVVDGGGSGGTITFATGGTGSSGAAMYGAAATVQGAAKMNARGNIPMGSFTASTTASGSGGGGGGGYSCLHPACPVDGAPAGALTVGGAITTPTGTAQIRNIVRRTCSEWFVLMSGEIEVARCTRGHLFYRATGEAVAVQDIRLGDLLASKGDHVEITGMALSYEAAELVGIDIAEPHLHFCGALDLLCHNGTAKP